MRLQKQFGIAILTIVIVFGLSAGMAFDHHRHGIRSDEGLPEARPGCENERLSVEAWKSGKRDSIHRTSGRQRRPWLVEPGRRQRRKPAQARAQPAREDIR